MRNLAKWCLVASMAVLAWSVIVTDSYAAKRPNNVNNAQRQAQAKQKQAQIQQMQAQRKAQEDALKREQAEAIKQFDTNKNGKIDGDEKAPYEKYLREKRLGKAGSSNAAKLTGKK